MPRQPHHVEAPATSKGIAKKRLAMASLLVRSGGNGFRLGCSSGEISYYRERQSGIIGEWQMVRIVFKQG
jgi:hypothetical protein